MVTESVSTSATLLGGTFLNAFTVFLTTIFSDILIEWCQWYLVALVLIIGDLITGIIASAVNNEHIRFSRAGRRTLCKCMEYLCISLCGIVISTAFHVEWFKYAIFGLTYMFELSSIVGNYYRARHKVIHIDMGKIISKWINKKADIDVDIDIEDMNEDKKDNRVRKGKQDEILHNRRTKL